jgi:hypothetical protein
MAWKQWSDAVTLCMNIQFLSVGCFDVLKYSLLPFHYTIVIPLFSVDYILLLMPIPFYSDDLVMYIVVVLPFCYSDVSDDTF